MKTDPKIKTTAIDAVLLRQKAEELLKERQLKADLPLSESEMQKLVHELGVHQIELELQNEELTLAKEKAEVASKKYVELYDSAPSGYFTLTKSGEIIELNLSGAMMLGKERSQLKNGLFGFFVSNDTKPIFNHFLRKVFTRKAEESCEVALSTNGESLKYVHLTGIVTENGKQCFITVIDVTERRQLEKERFENSEEHYRLLYENAKIGLYRTTPDGTILLANKALVAMLGYQSFDELAKRNLEQNGFEPPYQRKAFLEKIEQTGEVENFESTWIRQDRTPIFIKESALAIRDSHGNTIYYDGTAEDITQLKRTQDELDWNMALLEAKANSTTPNSSVDAILVVDLQGKKIIQNQRATDLLKVPQHIADKKDDESELLWVAGLNKDPQRFIERVKYLYAHPNEIGKDVLEYKDGTFLDRYTAPVVGKNGKYYGRLWIFRDITERRRTQASLRDSERRYRLLIETVNEGISVAQNGFLKFVNPMMQVITGFTQEELLSLPFLSFVYPEDREIVKSNHLKREKGEPFSPRYQFRIVKKDGSSRKIEMNGVVIEWEGEPASLNMFADITERELAEEEIKRKNEQLQKLNAEKDKLFSIIAHDLRGPFSGFLGLTEILAGDLQSLTMEEIQEYSESLSKSATKLYLLLENLLQWSRMQQGSIPFHPKVWQMLQVVEECMEMEPANNKGISIVYDIPDHIEVCADKDMLQSIIRNLVSNALKFTPKGGKIRISAKGLPDNSVEITVKDTGIGMSPSMVGDIFKLDAQTNRKGTEGEPSTGLGMLLCKEFVEKQRGTIWVESEEGKGSAFKFTLPMGNPDQ